MSLELETCGECYALTDNYFAHAEWHQKINALFEKATGIHPVCLEGHTWQSDFSGGYQCARCGTANGRTSE